MIAELVIERGAFEFPYISGSVPVKSNLAVPCYPSTVSLSLSSLPSSINSVADTSKTPFFPLFATNYLSMSLTLYSALD